MGLAMKTINKVVCISGGNASGSIRQGYIYEGRRTPDGHWFIKDSNGDWLKLNGDAWAASLREASPLAVAIFSLGEGDDEHKI